MSVEATNGMGKKKYFPSPGLSCFVFVLPLLNFAFVRVLAAVQANRNPAAAAIVGKGSCLFWRANQDSGLYFKTSLGLEDVVC